MQSLGFGCIFFAIDCFRGLDKKFSLAVNIFYGVFLLIAGIILILIYGYLSFGDFPTGENLPAWTLVVSILLTSYLYFFLPKTKIWKNRGKAKEPIEDGINFIFRMIGAGIMLVGAGHIILGLVMWLKSGEWTIIALGDWLSLERFDTGWWAINKVINYIMIDSSAALPLIAIGFIIYMASKDD
jgi:hypothetical protein